MFRPESNWSTGNSLSVAVSSTMTSSGWCPLSKYSPRWGIGETGLGRQDRYRPWWKGRDCGMEETENRSPSARLFIPSCPLFPLGLWVLTRLFAESTWPLDAHKESVGSSTSWTWTSKCGLRTSGKVIHWELCRNRIPTTEEMNQNLYFNEISRWFVCTRSGSSSALCYASNGGYTGSLDPKVSLIATYRMAKRFYSF